MKDPKNIPMFHDILFLDFIYWLKKIGSTYPFSIINFPSSTMNRTKSPSLNLKRARTRLGMVTW